MDRVLRAKIFAPFDALKGFREALRAKERVTVPKRELAEDRLAELDSKVRQMKDGDAVLVTYYRDGEYLTLAATVKKIDIMARELVFDGTMIDFDDIYDLDV